MAEENSAVEEITSLTRKSLRDFLTKHLRENAPVDGLSDEKISRIVTRAAREYFENVREPKQRSAKLDEACATAEKILREREARANGGHGH